MLRERATVLHYTSFAYFVPSQGRTDTVSLWEQIGAENIRT